MNRGLLELAGLAVILLLVLHLVRAEGRYDAERELWEQTADSLLTVEREAHEAAVDSMMREFGNQQDASDNAESAAGSAEASADSTRAEADSLDSDLPDLATAQDSISNLLAQAKKLRASGDSLRSSNDSLQSALDSQKRATASLLARIAKDSSRIVSLELTLASRPGKPKLLGLFPAPSLRCGPTAILTTAGQPAAGIGCTLGW